MTIQSLFSTLYDYLQYPFVINAIIVGAFISVCASLLGVTLVLKRFSYIGDGLSHVAFGAMAIAAVLNFSDNMPFMLAITMVCAVFLLKTGQRRLVKGDASLAMLSVSSMAIGYLLLNVSSSSTNISGDVCTTLFGSTSILTLSKHDVWLCILLSGFAILLYVLFYNKIFAVTFDERFSTAVGTPASIYNLGIALATAVIIVLAMKLVGSLLVTAIVIFPAISAMRLFKTFRSVSIFAAIFSLVCSILGTFISILASTPVGSTIVAVDLSFYLICWLISAVKK